MNDVSACLITASLLSQHSKMLSSVSAITGRVVEMLYYFQSVSVLCVGMLPSTFEPTQILQGTGLRRLASLKPLRMTARSRLGPLRPKNQSGPVSDEDAPLF